MSENFGNWDPDTVTTYVALFSNRLRLQISEIQEHICQL